MRDGVWWGGMTDRFLKATEMAHQVVRGRVNLGETVVDTTLGGGADLVFLSGCVGSEGKVIGFDVQGVALERSRARWEKSGGEGDVELHAVGHEHMGDLVSGEVAAVMFNLGYLPGGDKSVITRTETTLEALAMAVDLVRPGGVVTVVCYPGHEGGAEEADAVVAWAAGLEQEKFAVMRYGFLNQRNTPPFLVAVERLGGASR